MVVETTVQLHSFFSSEPRPIEVAGTGFGTETTAAGVSHHLGPRMQTAVVLQEGCGQGQLAGVAATLLGRVSPAASYPGREEMVSTPPPHLRLLTHRHVCPALKGALPEIRLSGWRWLGHGRSCRFSGLPAQVVGGDSSQLQRATAKTFSSVVATCAFRAAASSFS